MTQHDKLRMPGSSAAGVGVLPGNRSDAFIHERLVVSLLMRDMTTNSHLPDVNKMRLYGRISPLFRYQFRLVGGYVTYQRGVYQSCPLM